MKAVVFQGPGQVTVQERPKPQPQPGEVLIRVAACGICGTDAHIVEGSYEATPGVILGHEFAGTIVALGEGVEAFAVGDAVAVDPNITCGTCSFCQRGEKQLCQHLKALGVTRDGGFAEWCAVPQTQLYRLPHEMPTWQGAVAEPVACCLHGLDRLGLKQGETVLLLGGGAIGMLMLQLLQHAGATQVIVSEPNATRRERALRLGATAVLDPTAPDWESQVTHWFPEGPDRIIETAGAGPTLQQAIQVARRGATILYFGVARPELEVPIRPYAIYQKELTLTGSFVNPYTHGRAVSLLAASQLDCDALVTHRFPIEAFATALSTQKEAEAIKILILPHPIEENSP